MQVIKELALYYMDSIFSITKLYNRVLLNLTKLHQKFTEICFSCMILLAASLKFLLKKKYPSLNSSWDFSSFDFPFLENFL